MTPPVKEFKWNDQHSAWLKANWDKVVTEKEYVDAWLLRHPLRTSTKQAVKKYHYLKNTFGFFIGGK